MSQLAGQICTTRHLYSQDRPGCQGASLPCNLLLPGYSTVGRVEQSALPPAHPSLQGHVQPRTIKLSLRTCKLCLPRLARYGLFVLSKEPDGLFRGDSYFLARESFYHLPVGSDRMAATLAAELPALAGTGSGGLWGWYRVRNRICALE